MTRPDISAALATIGATWLAWTRASAAQLAAMFPDRSRVMRAVDALGVELPAPTDEALGLVAVSTWRAGDLRSACRRCPGDPRFWRVELAGVGCDREVSASDGLSIAEALLLVRRALFPVRAFGPRDMVAEALQFHARAMAASLRPRARIEVLRPAVSMSDLGRDWSGGYAGP